MHRSDFPKTSQRGGDLAEARIRPPSFKSSPLGKPPDGGGAKDACVSGSQKVQPPLGTCKSPQHLPWGRRSLAEPPWHRVVASRLRGLPPLSPTASRGGNPPRCVPPTCAPAPGCGHAARPSAEPRGGRRLPGPLLRAWPLWPRLPGRTVLPDPVQKATPTQAPAPGTSPSPHSRCSPERRHFLPEQVPALLAAPPPAPPPVAVTWETPLGASPSHV